MQHSSSFIRESHTKSALAVTLLLAVLLSACSHSGGSDDGGGGNGDGDGHVKQQAAPIPVVANHMRFTNEVPDSQKDAMNEAMSLLFAMPITQISGGVDKLMKVPNMSASTLQAWLESRVQYIVSESFDFQGNLDQHGPHYDYPNPNIVPNLSELVRPVASSGAQVAMVNLGGAIYAMAKRDQVLYSLTLPGISAAPVKFISPRVGLLQIGPGLFSDMMNGMDPFSRDVARAGILFHEARHSDGNGSSLTFLHAKCVDGDYKGLNACDLSLNGPYTIGAEMQKSLMNSCTNCSTESVEVLRLLYLDLSSRVVRGTYIDENTFQRKTYEPTNWDDAPEGSR